LSNEPDPAHAVGMVGYGGIVILAFFTGYHRGVLWGAAAFGVGMAVLVVAGLVHDFVTKEALNHEHPPVSVWIPALIAGAIFTAWALNDVPEARQSVARSLDKIVNGVHGSAGTEKSGQ
jgi:hypothetical protein